MVRTLTEIQNELKAPKSKYNSFGNYKYRSCEDILEAVKPLLKKYNAELTIRDDIVEVGGRVYVKAIAHLYTFDENGRNDGDIECTAFAREPLEKKKMDDSQITGTASSYARKYALNGLFLIDDTKDPDTDEYTAQTKDTEDTEKVRAQKIGTVKAKALVTMLTNDGQDVNALLAIYGVSKAEDLTEAQHLDLVTKWEKHKKDKNGNDRKA